MKKRNTKAIYIIRENNRDHYFFTHYAGGYSFPFAAARTLLYMHDAISRNPYTQSPIAAAPLLPQLVGGINHPGEAEGKPLFQQLTESEAAAYMDRTIHGDEIPFNITINVDVRTVAFTFNPLCKEISMPDMELPVYGGDHDYCGSAFETDANLLLLSGEDNQPVWELREDVYRQGLEQYALIFMPAMEMEQSI